MKVVKKKVINLYSPFILIICMRLALAVARSTLLQMQYNTKCYVHIGRDGSYPRSLYYKQISMMTRWVIDVSHEFFKINQGACGSSEQWTWMSKVPEGALSKKNNFYNRWTKTVDLDILCDLRRPILNSDYCSLELPLSAATWRPKAHEERRPLCKLQIKIGRFPIWRTKLLAGEVAYYLDCWN